MAGMTTGLRSRLEEIQRRKADLRDQLAAATRDRDQARADFAQNGGDPAPTNPAFRRAQDATASLERIRSQLELVGEEEKFVLSSIAGTGPFDGFGESFLRDPSTLRELAAMAESTSPIGKAALGIGVPMNDVMAMVGTAIQAVDPGGSVSFGDAGRRGPYGGIRPIPQRRLRFLDLLPTAAMDGRSFEYSQEVVVTPDDTGADPVVEGELKPETTFDFQDAEVVASTIAHWTKIRRQQLADAPQLESVIRSRLAWGVMRRLEGQVIAGDGTGQNLKGILNQTGVAAVAYDAAELASDLTLDGIVDVLLSDAEPNFVAISPRDWADMLKQKATGSGEYYSGGPFAITAERLWGTLVVPSKAIPSGKALIGDTTLGLTVFVREGVNILASDSDQDDFLRNRVSLLGEGRFGLAVWQPSAFAIVDLAP